MRATTTTRIAFIAILGATLSGCSTITDLISNEPPRDDDAQVTEAATESVFSVKVGDCLNADDLGSVVTDVGFIPCTEPHDSEVYASTEVEGDEYPSDMDQQAQDFCSAEFENFMGISYDDSEYDLFYLTPSTDTWTQMNDREILCIVTSDSADLTSSLEGSAR